MTSLASEQTAERPASSFTTGRFAGKAVIITGAASGIGEETARLFAAEGARCIVADVRGPASEVVAREIRDAGGVAVAVRTDVTDERSVAEMVGAAVDNFGRLDVLVNNAGGVVGPARHQTPLAELPVEAWDLTIALNLRSVFLCLKSGISAMLEQGEGGSIVNLASLAGLVGDNTTTAAYASAKAGVIHLTRHTAVQYAPLGIRVNSVSPGGTVTRQNEVIGEGEAARISVARRDELSRQYHPMGRMLAASEQAATIMFLASDAASGITGVNVPVDGGWSAR